MPSYIYVNGDSYSAAKKEHKVYSNWLQEKSNLPTVNQAASGSSNDRIIRTTLEHIATLDNQTKPFVIIGFSFVTREETWIDDITNYSHRIHDFPGSHFVSLDWLQDKDINEHTKHLIIDQNINKQMIHFYTKLYMLSQTLNSLDIPYFFFSAANNVDFRNLIWSSLNSFSVFNKIKQDSSILDFKTFNIPLWAKENNIETEPTGHLFSDGHKIFADFLFKQINQKL